MDMMNLQFVPTKDVLRYRSILKTERSFARQCDDSIWVDGLTHDIDILEAELNRRMGNPEGRA